MSEGIRTERRFGVTSKLTPEALRLLFVMRHHEGWPHLLDVMEMVCIEIESDLINTNSEEEAAVLAKHKMSKAAWMVFTHLQIKIDDEVSRFILSANQPLGSDKSDEEREVENIVNPLNFAIDDTGEPGEQGEYQ